MQKQAPAIVICLCSFYLALVSPSAAQSIQDGCWTILKYDNSGKVSGVIKGGACVNKLEGQLARLTDPEQIDPVENEYILLSTGSVDMKILQAHNAEVLAVEEFRLLGFLAFHIRVADQATFKALRSQVKRRIPGAILVQNDRYLSQAAPSAWPHQAQVQDGTVRSCGAGLTIGMIDGHVDPSRANLRKAKITSKDFSPARSRPGLEDHAAIVAELLVGQGRNGKVLGLLPSARLYTANVFGQTPKGGTVSTLLSLLKAIHWMLEKKVRVINFGVAGRGNDALTLALSKLEKKGVVVIAPAGNFGPTSSPVWPAAHRGTIAVTAVNRNNQRFDSANVGKYIDVAAMGVDIVVETSDGRRIVRGTSFATPFITAVSALTIGKSGRADVRQLRKELSRISRDLGSPGKDKEYGWGLVRYKPDC